VEYIDQMASDKLVYCDEMGVSNNITMLYGWSERGTRAYSEQAGFATERVNIVAGYNKGTKELIAPLEHSGYIDKQLFNQWVGELLCPSLKPGQCVIMDNASIHKSPLVKELIENAGCTLIYLPVYSPDLNSIEHCWANFKNYLSKIIKNFKDFRDAITAAMVKTFPC